MAGARRAAAAASVLVALGAAGCGAAHQKAAPAAPIRPSATSPTTTAAQPSATRPLPAPSTSAGTDGYQAQYLADAAAPDAYAASIRNATYAQLDTLATLVATNASDLRSQSWPAGARTDIRNMATALDALAADLRAGTVTGQSLVFADAKTVRADLGLAPPAASNQW